MTLTARVLALAAFVTPGVCVYGARGSVIIIAIAGVLALATHVFETRSLPRPPVVPTLAVGAILGWMASSATWAVVPIDALDTTVKVGAVMVSGLLMLTLSLSVRDDERRKIRGAYGIGFAIGVVLLAAESVAGGMLIQGLRGTSFTLREDVMASFNLTGAQYSLLVWPAIAAIPDRWRRATGWAVVAGVFALLASLNVATIVVGFCIGVAVFVLASRLPRVAVVAMAVVIVAAFALAPVYPRWLPSPASMVAWSPQPPMSLTHRVSIWHFAAERIAEHPVLGWGVHASRHIGERYSVPFPPELRSAELGPQRDAALLAFFRTNILPLHPHNGMIQLWLELGLGGAALGLALALWTLFAAARSSAPAAGIAQLATLLVLVGSAFGVWQSWWVATMWMLAAITTMTTPSNRERRR